MQDASLSIKGYWGIVRRRKLQLIVPAAVLFAIAVLIALVLPPAYQSTATILIVQQDIPQDLVRSTITSYADQRIQVLQQRIMTTENLTQVMDKYGLYKEMRKTKPLQAVVDYMRRHIVLSMVSAKVLDPRSGQSKKANIAFKLAFESENPATAQKIANELVSLYLNENIKTRVAQAEDTAGFLTDEVKRAQNRLVAIEGKIADFKEKHGNELPTLDQVNLAAAERVRKDLTDVRQQQQADREKLVFLESQLAITDPQSPVASRSRGGVMSPKERLRALEDQYTALSARYAADYPDVVRARQELKALRAQVGGGADVGMLEKHLAEVKVQLTDARQRYAEDHPDVKRLERAEKKIQAELAKARQTAKTNTKAQDTPNNPAYIQLQAQVQGLKIELRTLGRREADLKASLSRYEHRMTQAPEVERAYQVLVREHATASTEFQQLKAKQNDALLSQALERDRKGERFVLLEPPLLPAEPVKPNRLAIVMLGLVLSLSGGVGTVAAAEFLDSTVRGIQGVIAVLGAPPLATVPFIDAALPAPPRRSTKWLLFGGVLLVGLLMLVGLISYLYGPLDVFWYTLLRKLGI